MTLQLNHSFSSIPTRAELCERFGSNLAPTITLDGQEYQIFGLSRLPHGELEMYVGQRVERHEATPSALTTLLVTWVELREDGTEGLPDGYWVAIVTKVA